MENDDFSFTGLPSLTSGFKPCSSGDNLFINGSSMNFSQHGKCLNGDMNVNGISTVSHSSTSGTLTSAHQSVMGRNHQFNIEYDCLWSLTPLSSVNTGNFKEGLSIPHFPTERQDNENSVGLAHQVTSGHTSISGRSEICGNCVQDTITLDFGSKELYTSSQSPYLMLHSKRPSDYFVPYPAVSLQTTGSQPFGTVLSLQGDKIIEQSSASFMKEPTSTITENDTEIETTNRFAASETDFKTFTYSDANNFSGIEETVESSPQPAISTSENAESNFQDEASLLSVPLDSSQLLSSKLESLSSSSLTQDSENEINYDMEESDSEDGRAELEGTLKFCNPDCTEDSSVDDYPPFTIVAEDSCNSSIVTEDSRNFSTVTEDDMYSSTVAEESVDSSTVAEDVHNSSILDEDSQNVRTVAEDYWISTSVAEDSWNSSSVVKDIWNSSTETEDFSTSNVTAEDSLHSSISQKPSVIAEGSQHSNINAADNQHSKTVTESSQHSNIVTEISRHSSVVFEDQHCSFVSEDRCHSGIFAEDDQHCNLVAEDGQHSGQVTEDSHLSYIVTKENTQCGTVTKGSWRSEDGQHSSIMAEDEQHSCMAAEENWHSGILPERSQHSGVLTEGGRQSDFSEGNQKPSNVDMVVVQFNQKGSMTVEDQQNASTLIKHQDNSSIVIKKKGSFKSLAKDNKQLSAVIENFQDSVTTDDVDQNPSTVLSDGKNSISINEDSSPISLGKSSPKSSILTKDDQKSITVPEDGQKSTFLFTAASVSILDSCCDFGNTDGCQKLETLDVQTPVMLKKPGRATDVTADCNVMEITTPFKSENKETEAPNQLTNVTIRRRRIATQQQVCFPLQHGWRREVRIRKGSSRLQGETWYYAPCGKRMKQFPEVIKYLSRHQVQNVSREHFSFSPRMPVGDFYEEKETPEGLQWVMLTSEEIPSRIIALTGKRGRPRNTGKPQLKEILKVKRRRGRPAKVKLVDLLSKADIRLLKRLQSQEILTEEEKKIISKLKRKMRKKAKNKRKGDLEKAKMKEAKKMIKEEKEKEKEVEGKKMTIWQARKVERKLQVQRRLEERKRQQMILEEMKKPAEDMCLPDHKPLPDFFHIPGLILPGRAFSDCLMVVEFLHSYGKVLGFNIAKDVLSLRTLQEGLFNFGDSTGEVQSLLVKLLQAVLCDPGLPSPYQSAKILGRRISEIALDRDNVSEVLRIYLEACGSEAEFCKSLQTAPFQAHEPEKKAAILAFLVNELNGSTVVIREIDKTLDNMADYRRNKWIIEGKLRRLRAALAKKIGCTEMEIFNKEDGEQCPNSEVLDKNNFDGDGYVIKKNRMEEDEQQEGKNLASSSVFELEKQVEKLVKRQMFFRKKLLHASHSLRALLLGQDRYKRRYWVFPHFGGIFVEGSEELLVPDEPVKKEESVRTIIPKMYLVKNETEESPIKLKADGRSVRGRGRPRKMKCEPNLQELHIQRQMSTVTSEFPKPLPSSSYCPHDLSQSAFLSWLNQSQNFLGSSVKTIESRPAERQCSWNSAEKATASNKLLQCCTSVFEHSRVDAKSKKYWFSVLPRTPCDATSLTHPSSYSGQALKPQIATASPSFPRVETFRMCTFNQLFKESSRHTVEGRLTGCKSLPAIALPNKTVPHTCSTSFKGHSTNPHVVSNSVLLGFTVAGLPRRRGRPSSRLFKQIEQKYLSQLTAPPIPVGMRSGWWLIKSPEELDTLLVRLHPRGIREKALHKQLTRHLEYLKEVCARPKNDPVFELTIEESTLLSKERLHKWSVAEETCKIDLFVLQLVEDLEQRVVLSDLQLRGWMCTDPDSSREDLEYFAQKLDPTDDCILKNKKESSAIERRLTNPLDLAVLRLTVLEKAIERRYLKEPLWNQSEIVIEKASAVNPEATQDCLAVMEEENAITLRLRTWRQTLQRCRNCAQVALCIQQLEQSIAWERSINRVMCLVCRKGDDDEYLLLCDGCDRGCHMFCHRPPLTEIPEGDWYCRECTAKVSGTSSGRGYSKWGRKRKIGHLWHDSYYEAESPKRRVITRSQEKQRMTLSQNSRESLSHSKKRKMSKKNESPDLTLCEIILMEMESHADAWPFLEPVNPKLVHGYRKLIKYPMDFGTMREKLLTGGYASCEEFAADAELVFDNCQTFNEDDSVVGIAGLAMRNFFQRRWAELYQEK
ncbi:bromodomain adjacent to zinc finger domain protein 2A [Protopterus annectens]|uniref:bromodomain adjacent to zinc finger domain protein 2A n=1 Tax=Protopterus annectens TaxID=7888 RepID=UPI001CF9A925|nr:bromodomain adjacent to zinc finger domain protein 2A [Protopterus annectens]